MRTPLRRAAMACLAACVFSATSSAYYHFVHFAGRSAPFVPIRERFDLSALANKTVYFFVSESGPSKLDLTDSAAASLTQLRMAGKIWNDVESSDLRVAYGGQFTPGTPMSRPHIEVSFTDEIPPGLLAQGGVTSRAEVSGSGPSAFVPILNSVVLLNRDISTRPSYSSGFFLTAVHELGHALGLQHTLTSSVMSVEVTRATTKAAPLAADDIAGISLLYPTARFTSQFGSISGRVTMSGDGVHLASVVALPPSGHGVSALTNPDGTYRIDGIPPGPYFIYAHPLPPQVQDGLGPADIVLPIDAEGKQFPASDPFRSEFYPGTRDPDAATLVNVGAGGTVTDINFAVERRGSVRLYGVSTYSYPGALPVKPAFINTNNPDGAVLLASGTGLTPNNAPAAGLRASVLGNSVLIAGRARIHPDNSSFILIYFAFHPFTVAGPRHLVFSTPDDLYVLPSAFTMVHRQPPSIDSIVAETDGGGNAVLAIAGPNIGADTRILFDGLPPRSASYDEDGQRLLVTPPPGTPAHRASVVALNSDGQTSMFVQYPPLQHAYDTVDAPAASLSQYSLPAGVEAMIEVNGVATNFTTETRLGFGSSDITVKRMWVVSPTLLRASVVAAPSAQPGSTLFSVVSGFQSVSQPGAFQVTAGNPDAVRITSDLVNAATGERWVYPGAPALLTVANLTQAAARSLTLTINDAPVTVASAEQNQVVFQVPSSLAPGPAVLRLILQNASDSPPPVIVAIDPAPPVITAIRFTTAPASLDNAAAAGDVLTLRVSGLGQSGSQIAQGRFRLSVAGIEHPSLGDARPAPETASLHEIMMVLLPQTPPGPQPVTISIDNRTSAPFILAVRAPAANREL